MDILEIIDELEQAIETGRKPILQNDKVIMETALLYEFVDQLRANLPDAIRDAQWVKKDEERILATAKEEHDRIINDAQEHARALIDQTEIVRGATHKGDQIISDAQHTAHDITEGAFMYAQDIMEKIENQLTIYYEVIQEGRAEIQKSIDAMQTQQEQAYELDHDE